MSFFFVRIFVLSVYYFFLFQGLAQTLHAGAPKTWVTIALVTSILEGFLAAVLTMVIFRSLHVPLGTITLLILLLWFGLNDLARVGYAPRELIEKRLAELFGDAFGVLAGSALLWPG